MLPSSEGSTASVSRVWSLDIKTRDRTLESLLHRKATHVSAVSKLNSTSLALVRVADTCQRRLSTNVDGFPDLRSGCATCPASRNSNRGRKDGQGTSTPFFNRPAQRLAKRLGRICKLHDYAGVRGGGEAPPVSSEQPSTSGVAFSGKPWVLRYPPPGDVCGRARADISIGRITVRHLFFRRDLSASPYRR